MRLELTSTQCYCRLVDFYENVCDASGRDASELDLRFDCTKVHVSSAIQEKIFDFYKTFYHSTNEGFAALWVLYGPKADIEEDGFIVEIEDGFFAKREVNDEEA